MLLLSATFPFPPIGGERIWVFNIIKYLTSTWQIDLCTFIENEQEKESIKDYHFNSFNFDTVTLPKLNSYLNCLKGFLDVRPLQTHYYFSKVMQRLINQKLNSVKYDLILCHLIRMAQYVKNYQNIKKVLYMADALSLRYALSSEFRKVPFKFLEWLESKKLRRYEPKISTKFNLNLISSSLDKFYLEKKLGIQSLDVIENGVELLDGLLVENQEIQVDPKKIVFFANLRTFHNIDAVMYFYKYIFPLIKIKIKDVKFNIVGANIPRCILKMSKDKSISIFKDVSDIRPYICDACVSVTPMRVAVGIQNKILQSMALKVPVVATSRGLGGIQAKPDRDILIADNPYDFAAKVIMLMQRESLRDYIRANAYRLIKEKYLWPNIVEGLNRKLISFLEK